MNENLATSCLLGRCFGAFVLCCLCLPIAALAAAPVQPSNISTAIGPLEKDKNRIARVEFEGNEQTRAQVMRNELYIEIGDTVDEAQIEKSRQAMMNLGLFDSVTTRVEDSSELWGGKTVTFTVEEKRFYILVLPRGSYDNSGDSSYGMEFEWDNFLGLNQKLEIKFDRKNTAEEDRGNGNRLRANFSYPAVLGSKFDFGVGASYSDFPVELVRSNNNVVDLQEQDRRVFTSLGYRFSKGGQTTGWTARAGLLYWQRENEPEPIAQELFGGDTLGWNAGVQYQNIDFNLYSETGIRFFTAIGNSFSRSANDFNFSEFRAGLLLLTKGFGTPHHNLNFDFDIGVGSGGPPGTLPFGFNSDIARGYDKGDRDGEAFAAMTIEYLMPVFGLETLRLYSFLDVGNVWLDKDDIALSEVRTSVGAGVRWRPKAFVSFELDLGVAYAVDDSSFDLLLGSNRR